MNPTFLSEEQKEKIHQVWRDFPKTGKAVLEISQLIHTLNLPEAQAVKLTEALDELIITVAGETENRVHERMESALKGLGALIDLAKNPFERYLPKRP